MVKIDIKAKTIRMIESSLLSLFQGNIVEEEFVQKIHNSVELYFNTGSYLHDDLHRLLFNIQIYVNCYEKINIDWLVAQVYESLYSRVFLPENRHYEMSKMADIYFKKKSKEVKNHGENANY